MEYSCHTCAGDDRSSDHPLLIHFTGNVEQAALTPLLLERIFYVASTRVRGLRRWWIIVRRLPACEWEG